MFVRKKKYDTLQLEYLQLMGEMAMLQLKIVGLEELLRMAREKAMKMTPEIKKVSHNFTQEEIKKLLMLCHPDKHNGKQMAVEMTQKLLALRK
jgi:hypothetical protein